MKPLDFNTVLVSGTEKHNTQVCENLSGTQVTLLHSFSYLRVQFENAGGGSTLSVLTQEISCSRDTELTKRLTDRRENF